MNRDAKKIASMVDIVDVISESITLKKKGATLVGMCPFHNDHKSSLTVNKKKQIFKCFACGAGGNAIHFLKKTGLSYHQALDKIEYGIAPLNTKPLEPITLIKNRDWKQVLRPDRFPGKIRHYLYGKPDMVWGYHNADGHPMGYICRFDVNGGKEVIPYVYATDGKTKEWRFMGFDKPRPLYNLPELLKYKTRPVVVVEGEKTVDAARKLLPDHIVVSWMGGAEAVINTDFTPLNNRDVMFIPDNDEPGFRAMKNISDMITPSSKWFVDTSCMELHWDIADEPEWDTINLMMFIGGNTVHELIYNKELNISA